MEARAAARGNTVMWFWIAFATVLIVNALAVDA